MKKLLAIAALAAVLLTTVPVNARLSRMSIKPINIVGAFIGLGSTKYMLQQARQTPQAKATTTERHFDCEKDIAQATFNMLKAHPSYNSDEYQKWMRTKTQAFNYCQKIIASREEIYARNIAFALYKAQNNYNHAQYIFDTFPNTGRDAIIAGHGYTQTAKQLQYELQKERAQITREVEMLTWLYFA